MALGRGLGSLIPQKVAPLQAASSSSLFLSEKNIQEIPLDQIRANPKQPRKTFHDLQELAESVRRYGVLQPIVVTKLDDGYELVAGERRFQASRLAQKKTIPAVIRDASEMEKLELALIENIQRTDLNSMEKSEGYRELIDSFGLKQEEAAKRMGVSRSAFANTLRLLTLPEEIQMALREEKISEGHAKTILGLKNKDEQLRYFRKLFDASGKRLSVRALEAQVYSSKSSEMHAWEEELEHRYGTKVEVKEKKGRGTVIFRFYSEEDLRSLMQQLLGPE